MVRLAPSRATAIASSSLRGIPYVRTKSQPVPRGITASSASRPASPWTTSLTVPSPPTATTSLAPSSTARAASSPSCPARSERTASPVSPRVAARSASPGQRRPTDPPSAAGLTRKTISLMACGDGLERHARHPVDGRAQLLVGDPGELLADHDVAHGQQATGLHSAESADREQHRRLHLDAEDAPRGPALVPLGVGVVERVAGGNRADAHGLVELFRRVNRAVHELPVGSGRVRLAADVMARGAVRGHRRDRDDQVAELQIVLEPAAGSDAEEPLHAQLDELLHDDR